LLVFSAGDVALCAHLGIEPDHILLSDGAIDLLPQSESVVLARACLEGDGAECENGDSQAYELKGSYTYAVDDGVLC
jgi:hypothetical protein